MRKTLRRTEHRGFIHPTSSYLQRCVNWDGAVDYEVTIAADECDAREIISFRTFAEALVFYTAQTLRFY